MTRVLQRSRPRRVEQRAHHDRRAREATRLGNECRVGALAGTGGTAQENDLLWETQILSAELGLEILPDRFEDQVTIFDLQIVGLAPDRVSTWLIHEIHQRVVRAPDENIRVTQDMIYNPRCALCLSSRSARVWSSPRSSPASRSASTLPASGPA